VCDNLMMTKVVKSKIEDQKANEICTLQSAVHLVRYLLQKILFGKSKR